MSSHDMNMTTVTTEAVSLHVEEEGSGAPALVFLHYWGGSARTWTAVMDRLGSSNRCVAIDQRGWGRSEAPASGYAIRDLADDALEVIAALELDDYVVVGHSMGGKIAQVVAGDRPAGLRGVVLIAPAPAAPAAPITDEFREQLRGAYLTRDGVLEGLEIVGSYQGLSPELREQVVSDSMAGAPQARHAWPNTMISEDVSSALTGIDVPVLVLGADHDPIEPVSLLAEHVVARIAGAALEVISDSGHLVPLEQPQQVAGHITAFVDRLTPAAAPSTLTRSSTSEPTGGKKMTVATATQNKQTIQRMFEAFRSGDTDAFDQLIVEDYIQHNPQVDNGLAPVKAFFAAAGPVDVEVHRIIAEDDLVAVHSHFKTWNMAVVDIFRLNDEGKAVEHWDVLQPIPDTTASGNDMFSQLS